MKELKITDCVLCKNFNLNSDQNKYVKPSCWNKKNSYKQDKCISTRSRPSLNRGLLLADSPYTGPLWERACHRCRS